MTLPNTPADIRTKIETLLAHLDLIQTYTQLISEIERQSAPNDLHDRKTRLQMTTLLSRPESLYALLMIYLAPRAVSDGTRRITPGLPYNRRVPLTKAGLASALWQHSHLKQRTIEPTRAQYVQASRIIDAALAFNLAGPVPGPDKKQRPVTATPDLENLIRLLSVQLEKREPSHEQALRTVAYARCSQPHLSRDAVAGPIREDRSTNPQPPGS